MGVASNVMKMVAGADHIGELQAWDLDTGKKVWTTNLPSFNWGPVLATGGGVLFAGGTNDHVPRLRCQDRQDPVGVPDRIEQWPRCRSRSRSTASSTSRCSRAGASIPAKMQARMNLIFPGEYPDVPQGGSIWVFAVK